MSRVLTALLVAFLVAVLGCGPDPGSVGAPDPEVEEVALVRAEALVGHTAPFDRLAVEATVAPLVDRPAPNGVGREPRAWVASFVADGEWRLVFKAETGPCLVDCAGQRYWYFVVSPDGEPTPAGRYALVVSRGEARAEGEPRWGFPGEAERRLLETARAGGR
ncbi:MAG TPA: hypothetical protein VIM86_03030 [Thermodesulfobacteriota bacterium]